MAEVSAEQIGREEFENLYGPLEEHMYYLDEFSLSSVYRGISPGDAHWHGILTPPERIEEEGIIRFEILSTFKKWTEEGFAGFLTKQKAGTILNKEELAGKRGFFMARRYVLSKMDELEKTWTDWERRHGRLFAKPVHHPEIKRASTNGNKLPAKPARLRGRPRQTALSTS